MLLLSPSQGTRCRSLHVLTALPLSPIRASSIEALSLDNEPQSSSRTLDVAARRRLLQQYGYESDEDEDGDGQEKEDQPLAAANRNAVKAVADAKKNEARKYGIHVHRAAPWPVVCFELF